MIAHFDHKIEEELSSTIEIFDDAVAIYLEYYGGLARNYVQCTIYYVHSRKI